MSGISVEAVKVVVLVDCPYISVTRPSESINAARTGGCYFVKVLFGQCFGECNATRSMRNHYEDLSWLVGVLLVKTVN